MPAYFADPETLALNAQERRTLKQLIQRHTRKANALKSQHSKPSPTARKPIPRKPVKKRNARRQRSEFARCYHSKARVAFVKSLPCFATGKRGNSDNAHVTRDGSEGMGRKGGYRCIAPLSREAHRLWDTNRARFTERFGDYDGEKMAAWTQREWEKYLASSGVARSVESDTREENISAHSVRP